MDDQNDKSIIEMLKNSPEAIIAAMARDIHYLTKSVDGMAKTLEHMDDNYVKQSELEEMKKDRDSTRAEIWRVLESKVDKNDFEPIKSTLVKINWLLIAAFFAALLALIFKN